MSLELCEAIRVHARYDLPNENGITRRERNEKTGFEDKTPLKIISEEGEYLWLWYEELRNWVSRINDGICRLIPPSEFLAWSQISGNYSLPEELKVMHEMDAAFCEVITQELKDYRTRRNEEQRLEVEASKSKKGKKNG